MTMMITWMFLINCRLHFLRNIRKPVRNGKPGVIITLRISRTRIMQPGEEKRVVFLLRVSDWASFDTQRDDWTVEPGTYHVYVGNCSRGQFKTLDIQVTGYDVYGFNEETVMGTVAATPGALEAMCAFCPEGMGITKESIEASILYQPSGSVRAYWKNRVEPELPGSSEEKEAVYQKMLHVLNRFK